MTITLTIARERLEPNPLLDPIFSIIPRVAPFLPEFIEEEGDSLQNWIQKPCFYCVDKLKNASILSEHLSGKLRDHKMTRRDRVREIWGPFCEQILEISSSTLEEVSDIFKRIWMKEPIEEIGLDRLESCYKSLALALAAECNQPAEVLREILTDETEFDTHDFWHALRSACYHKNMETFRLLYEQVGVLHFSYEENIDALACQFIFSNQIEDLMDKALMRYPAFHSGLVSQRLSEYCLEAFIRNHDPVNLKKILEREFRLRHQCSRNFDFFYRLLKTTGQVNSLSILKILFDSIILIGDFDLKSILRTIEDLIDHDREEWILALIELTRKKMDYPCLMSDLLLAEEVKRQNENREMPWTKDCIRKNRTIRGNLVIQSVVKNQFAILNGLLKTGFIHPKQFCYALLKSKDSTKPAQVFFNLITSKQGLNLLVRPILGYLCLAAYLNLVSPEKTETQTEDWFFLAIPTLLWLGVFTHAYKEIFAVEA